MVDRKVVSIREERPSYLEREFLERVERDVSLYRGVAVYYLGRIAEILLQHTQIPVEEVREAIRTFALISKADQKPVDNLKRLCGAYEQLVEQRLEIDIPHQNRMKKYGGLHDFQNDRRTRWNKARPGKLVLGVMRDLLFDDVIRDLDSRRKIKCKCKYL